MQNMNQHSTSWIFVRKIRNSRFSSDHASPGKSLHSMFTPRNTASRMVIWILMTSTTKRRYLNFFCNIWGILCTVELRWIIMFLLSYHNFWIGKRRLNEVYQQRERNQVQHDRNYWYGQKRVCVSIVFVLELLLKSTVILYLMFCCFWVATYYINQVQNNLNHRYNGTDDRKLNDAEACEVVTATETRVSKINLAIFNWEDNSGVIWSMWSQEKNGSM